MDLGLTSEQKLTALRAAESGIQNEIFNMLLRMGIDPDTYNPAVDNDLIDSMFTGEKNRVTSLLASLEMVRTKIQSLS
jgi:hypothetical protein